MIGHYVKPKWGLVVLPGGEASFDELVCVSLNPFIVVSPASYYVFREFTQLDFTMGGRVPEGVWWRCLHRVYGRECVLSQPVRWPRHWLQPEVMLVHDYPACATFRGGRCTCDVAYE